MFVDSKPFQVNCECNNQFPIWNVLVHKNNVTRHQIFLISAMIRILICLNLCLAISKCSSYGPIASSFITYQSYHKFLFFYFWTIIIDGIYSYFKIRQFHFHATIYYSNRYMCVYALTHYLFLLTVCHYLKYFRLSFALSSFCFLNQLWHIWVLHNLLS